MRVDANYRNQTLSKQRIGSAFLWMMVVLFCTMIHPCSFAQTTTGTISGTVADPTGSVIPNAKVIVTNVQTGIAQTVQSNASGNYIFPALAVGDYVLTAIADSFGTTTEKGLHLDASQNLTADVQLKPGTETLES